MDLRRVEDSVTGDRISNGCSLMGVEGVTGEDRLVATGDLRSGGTADRLISGRKLGLLGLPTAKDFFRLRGLSAPSVVVDGAVVVLEAVVVAKVVVGIFFTLRSMGESPVVSEAVVFCCCGCCTLVVASLLLLLLEVVVWGCGCGDRVVLLLGRVGAAGCITRTPDLTPRALVVAALVPSSLASTLASSRDPVTVTVTAAGGGTGGGGGVVVVLVVLEV